MMFPSPNLAGVWPEAACLKHYCLSIGRLRKEGLQQA